MPTVRQQTTVPSGRSLALLAAAGAVLLWPASALAHGGTSEPAAVESRPWPEETITRAPEEVLVTFNLPLANVGGHRLTVTDPDGNRVDDGTPQVVGDRSSTLRVPLKDLDASGTYAVRFAGFVQGHTADGEYTFTYQAPPGGMSGTQGQVLAGGVGVVTVAAVAGVAVSRRRPTRTA